MKKKLVIVESPSKATTIKKYLGSGYNVVASMGHIIDLPKSQLGIDLEDGFKPKYITIRGKGDLVKSLKREAKTSSKIFLATDPDREGEAISWHLANLLGIDLKENCRVTFNEITKKAVTQGIKEPRAINEDLVNSQQARRVLDRIVGYKISPILWKKVRKGLSAGRVQSVATKLICDREKEINEFESKEYWTIEATLISGKKKFKADFYGKNGRKTELNNSEAAQKVLSDIEGNPFIVKKIKKATKKKVTAPPFITSTLQQEAGRKLSFTSQRTMQAAQQLYEGINIKGKGFIGLITYMRTDSLRVSDDAVNEARIVIEKNYGLDYLPQKAKVYKTKKGAQDAHEAIRPTYPDITPESIKTSLTPDQFKIYKIIWERFIASQMADAIFDTVSADLEVNSFVFRATGQTVKFPGFTLLYTESNDTDEKKEAKLPELKEGDNPKCDKIDPQQHFTQPPAHYTEASLIKIMEEKGIGRPSTYSPIITTIIARGYVVRNKKALVPTELGMIVNDIMCENFRNIVDVGFTANMEENLDKIEDGKLSWESLLEEFYGPFNISLKEAEDKIGDIEIKDEVSDIECEKCGRLMVYKHGKFGKFLACPGFPECRNTKAIVKGIGINCPKCGKEIIEKKSKRGKIFYGCTSYPECDFTSWDKPTDEKCSKCGSMMFEKTGRIKKKYCPECEGENK